MVVYNEFTKKLGDDLVKYLDEWFAKDGIWDNELDKLMAQWTLQAPTVFPKRPYFSPSATNACPRMLYEKGIGADRDVTDKAPYQGRWQAIGEAIGGVIQTELLKAERYYASKGIKPKFRFLRNKDGQPTFEEFIKTNKRVRVPNKDGEVKEFYLFGLPDGIMEYTDAEGNTHRVGLEIKSKQTTSARTSLYSMREPEESHVKQCVAYSHMYDVDHYIVLYVNASKKSWVYTDEEYEKTPDIRAFGLQVSTKDKFELFSGLADIQTIIDEAKEGKEVTPPKLDLDRWTFNNYKTACVASLTDEELSEIESYALRVEGSALPAMTKNNVSKAFSEILSLYNKLKGDGEDESDEDRNQ